jgi:hypothetical protein
VVQDHLQGSGSGVLPVAPKKSHKKKPATGTGPGSGAGSAGPDLKRGQKKVIAEVSVAGEAGALAPSGVRISHRKKRADDVDGLLGPSPAAARESHAEKPVGAKREHTDGTSAGGRSKRRRLDENAGGAAQDQLTGISESDGGAADPLIKPKSTQKKRRSFWVYVDEDSYVADHLALQEQQASLKRIHAISKISAEGRAERAKLGAEKAAVSSAAADAGTPASMCKDGAAAAGVQGTPASGRKAGMAAGGQDLESEPEVAVVVAEGLAAQVKFEPGSDKKSRVQLKPERASNDAFGGRSRTVMDSSSRFMRKSPRLQEPIIKATPATKREKSGFAKGGVKVLKKKAGWMYIELPDDAVSEDELLGTAERGRVKKMSVHKLANLMGSDTSQSAETERDKRKRLIEERRQQAELTRLARDASEYSSQPEEVLAELTGEEAAAPPDVRSGVGRTGGNVSTRKRKRSETSASVSASINGSDDGGGSDALRASASVFTSSSASQTRRDARRGAPADQPPAKRKHGASVSERDSGDGFSGVKRFKISRPMLVRVGDSDTSVVIKMVSFDALDGVSPGRAAGVSGSNVVIDVDDDAASGATDGGGNVLSAQSAPMSGGAREREGRAAKNRAPALPVLQPPALPVAPADRGGGGGRGAVFSSEGWIRRSQVCALLAPPPSPWPFGTALTPPYLVALNAQPGGTGVSLQQGQAVSTGQPRSARPSEPLGAVSAAAASAASSVSLVAGDSAAARGAGVTVERRGGDAPSSSAPRASRRGAFSSMLVWD